MKTIVKHKAGKFMADWKSTFKVFFYLLFGKHFVVTIEITPEQVKNLPYDTPEFDWLKVCGFTKIGMPENREEDLIVYRKNQENNFETAIYCRWESNEDFIEGRLFTTFAHSTVLHVIRHLIRDSGFVLPAIPWAGGTNPPKKDFSYTLTIKRE